MSTISSAITQTVTLGSVSNYPTYASPLTILSAGTVTLSGAGDAVYGPMGTAWSIDNQGHITAAGFFDGVNLRSGGSVLNTGTIIGGRYGVLIYGTAGSVGNYGTIETTATGRTGVYGVELPGGSMLTNGSSGVILGGAEILGYGSVGNAGSITNATGDGVFVFGTVVDSGLVSAAGDGIVAPTVTVSGTVLAGRDGVRAPGGAVTIVTGGTVSAAGYGVLATGTGATVVNGGIVASQNDYYFGVVLFSGGLVSNTASGNVAGGVEFVYGSGTLVNSGSVANTLGDAVRLGYGGGTVIDTGGLSAGIDGIEIDGSGYVTIGAGAMIAAGQIGVYLAASGTVDNRGTVTSPNNYTYSVELYDGGSVVNRQQGSLGNGIEILNSGGTARNYGVIAGPSGDGILLAGGGSVLDTGSITAAINGIEADAGGTVTVAAGGGVRASNAGIYIAGGAGTVLNSGSVFGGFYGANLTLGGSVTNTSGGYLAGVQIAGTAGRVANYGTIIDPFGAGVVLAAGGTLVDSGTIISGYGADAVDLGGSSTNLLILKGTTSSIAGGVYGTSGASNTLELMGSAGAPASADYTGLSLANFTDLLFGSGGSETLVIDNTSGTLAPIVSGFTIVGTDLIDLSGIANGQVTPPDASDQVTVSGSGGTVTLKLDPSSAGVPLQTVPDGHNGTDLLVACFCRGTNILSEFGEVPVEQLAIGDRVVTRSGRLRPVKWIGRRGYDGRFIAGNPEVLPIAVHAGALGDGVPRRDLRLSPHHALLLDEVLVPVECLVNGVSIVQLPAVERIEYFHVELETHDVILAEGTAAETFVDCDSRQMFHNACEFAALYPGEEPPRWAFCAPRLEDDPAVEALWQRIARRAGIAVTNGRLQGNLDAADRERVRGWARDGNTPDMPVLVEFVADGVVLGRSLANRCRPDLVKAGLGRGRHGFEFSLPAPLPSGRPHMVVARRAADGALLTGAPLLLPSARTRVSGAA